MKKTFMYILGAIFAISILSSLIKVSTKPETVEPVVTSPMNLEEFAKSKIMQVGECLKLYRLNTKYRYKDNSFMVFNFASIKQYPKYQQYENCIVIETETFMHKTKEFASFFVFELYNRYGKELLWDKVFTYQGEHAEMIITLQGNEPIDFFVVGEIDRTMIPQGKIAFQVK